MTKKISKESEKNPQIVLQENRVYGCCPCDLHGGSEMISAGPNLLLGEKREKEREREDFRRSKSYLKTILLKMSGESGDNNNNNNSNNFLH